MVQHCLAHVYLSFGLRASEVLNWCSVVDRLCSPSVLLPAFTVLRGYTELLPGERHFGEHEVKGYAHRWILMTSEAYAIARAHYRAPVCANLNVPGATRISFRERFVSRQMRRAKSRPRLTWHW